MVESRLAYAFSAAAITLSFGFLDAAKHGWDTGKIGAALIIAVFFGAVAAWAGPSMARGRERLGRGVRALWDERSMPRDR